MNVRKFQIFYSSFSLQNIYKNVILVYLLVIYYFTTDALCTFQYSGKQLNIHTFYDVKLYTLLAKVTIIIVIKPKLECLREIIWYSRESAQKIHQVKFKLHHVNNLRLIFCSLSKETKYLIFLTLAYKNNIQCLDFRIICIIWTCLTLCFLRQ